VSLATFGAFALLGAVLAYWVWVWVAPRPEPRAQALAQAEGTGEHAAGLFGSGQRDRNGAAATGMAVKLLGVIAATGSRPSYALLRLDGKKTLAVLQGEELEPGLRLAEVHVDHIVLERSGARETLAWPEKNSK
jgi:general secretion pathway protein C